MNNAAAKFLPIVSDEKKIDVSLTEDQAVIKLSTWTEDLGWLCQKTLAVDVAMLDDLHRVIASARYRLTKQNASAEKAADSPNIIEFPSFA